MAYSTCTVSSLQLWLFAASSIKQVPKRPTESPVVGGRDINYFASTTEEVDLLMKLENTASMPSAVWDRHVYRLWPETTNLAWLSS
jgi:hypothetical protein